MLNVSAARLCWTFASKLMPANIAAALIVYRGRDLRPEPDNVHIPVLRELYPTLFIGWPDDAILVWHRWWAIAHADVVEYSRALRSYLADPTAYDFENGIYAHAESFSSSLDDSSSAMVLSSRDEDANWIRLLSSANSNPHFAKILEGSFNPYGNGQTIEDLYLAAGPYFTEFEYPFCWSFGYLCGLFGFDHELRWIDRLVSQLNGVNGEATNQDDVDRLIILPLMPDQDITRECPPMYRLKRERLESKHPYVAYSVYDGKHWSQLVTVQMAKLQLYDDRRMSFSAFSKDFAFMSCTGKESKEAGLHLWITFVGHLPYGHKTYVVVFYTKDLEPKFYYLRCSRRAAEVKTLSFPPPPPTPYVRSPLDIEETPVDAIDVSDEIKLGFNPYGNQQTTPDRLRGLSKNQAKARIKSFVKRCSRKWRGKNSPPVVGNSIRCPVLWLLVIGWKFCMR